MSKWWNFIIWIDNIKNFIFVTSIIFWNCANCIFWIFYNIREIDKTINASIDIRDDFSIYIILIKKYIINIGIDFEIMTYRNYNSNEILLNCIKKLKSYFDIHKWQINQPIIISNVYKELTLVEGVTNLWQR